MSADSATPICTVSAHHLSAGMGTVPVCFTPDGLRWISAAGNPNLPASPGGLKFWDAATGVCLRNLASEGLTSVQTLAVSSVGGLLAVGYVDANAPIEIRDLVTGRLLSTLATPSPGGQTRRLAFSPDGCVWLIFVR